ncbi:hypothetical protein ON010_g6009 [Phytophthora cinnamomi]|nr:hypothetical protein ON010_g6009 [Phytophthora cinnamomi]
MASAIFRDVNLMDSLKRKLVRDNMSSLVPTGIPPYIHLYEQQRETKKAIERMPDVLLSGISKLLDEKRVGTGAMRKEELQSTIRELLTEVGLYQRTTVQTEVCPQATHGTIIYWSQDGKFHRLPENLSFLTLMRSASGTCGGLEIHLWLPTV